MFAGKYKEVCSVTSENLKKFKSEGLMELEADMKKLIDVLSGSSSTYKAQKKKLQEQIEILQGIADTKTNGAISMGVGVGIFVVLGAAAIIATIATGGGAAPALIILAAIGVPCIAGLSALGVFCAQAEAAQKQIREITAQMEAGDVSIAQLDTYGETYGGFVSQIDEVAEALETMAAEWDNLSEELTKLSKEVEEANTSISKAEWAVLEDQLTLMAATMDELETKIHEVRIDKTMVSKGSYSFEMTEEEM